MRGKIRLLELVASQDISTEVAGIKMPNIGVVEAEHSIGHSYHEGVGVQQDFGKTFDWFTQAIKDDIGVSANYIGTMYKSGQGVPLSIERALDYY